MNFNHVDSTQNIISFCTGIRGLERGLEMLFPIRARCFVEIEAFAIANLVAEMEAGFLAPSPIWTNAKTFDPKPFRGKIHGIVGGYPCQPFSRAGKRGGDSDPRHLWPNILATIKTVRPIWCFFENVSDHLNMGYDEVYKSLRTAGYRVEPGLFSAEEVGAPHLRKRLFILALDNTRGFGFKPEYPISAGWNSAFPAGKRELANTTGQGLQEPGGAEPGQFNEAGKEMADTACFRPVHGENEVQSTEGGQQSFGDASPGSSEEELAHPDSQQHDRSGGAWERGAEPTNGGTEELANQSGIGLQRGRETGRSSPAILREQELFIWRSCWPAGQGAEQYEWEEPRTVESGVGCTIDGYNFREDLIRAFGNAVVSQVAAKAFYFLHKKLTKND